MVDGLIVAAGVSSRTHGQFKMLLDLHGKPLIQRTVDCLRPACSRIILVTGCHADRLNALFAGQKDVELVHNPNFQTGMFSSVKSGLQHVLSSRFFFLPGDCPLIPRSVLRSLLEMHAPIVVPAYAGMPGHPVLMQSSLIDRILKDKTIQSLRDFIQANDPQIVAVDSEGILFDIDTLADYDKALALIED